MANHTAVLGLTVFVLLVLNSVDGFSINERTPEKRGFIFGNMVKGMANLMTDMIKAPAHAIEGAIDFVNDHHHHHSNQINVPIVIPGGLNILKEKPVVAKTRCEDKLGIDCSVFMKDISICSQDRLVAVKYCAKSCKFC